MKVLQVITGLDAGGAELQLAMLVQRTQHEADVVVLYNAGPVADQIRASAICPTAAACWPRPIASRKCATSSAPTRWRS